MKEAAAPAGRARDLVGALILHLIVGYLFVFAAGTVGAFFSIGGLVLFSISCALWLAAGALIVARWRVYREGFRQLRRTSGAWLFIAAAWFILVPLLMLALPAFRHWAGLSREPRRT